MKVSIVSMFAGAAALAVASASFGASTVGVLNPAQVTGTGFGQVTNSPNGSSNANFIPIDTFRTLVATAFTANVGGVADFNEATSTPPGSFPTTAYGGIGLTPAVLPITFGTSQTNSIGISRSAVAAAGATAFGLDSGSNNNIVNGSNVYSSGTSYLGFTNGADPGLLLTPSSLPLGFGITAVGFTVLDRGAARTVSVSFVLDNGTVVPLVGGTATAAADSLVSGGPSLFYGYRAPVGRSISIINYSDSAAGALRVDDLAFITSIVAVPEPTTLAAVAGGALALLRRRRSI